MNIEELKLIVQTILQLGDMGKDTLIWYIVLTHGLSFLQVLCILVSLVFVVLKTTRILSGNKEEKLRVLRDTMGVGTSGFFTEEEYMLMLQWTKEKKSK